MYQEITEDPLPKLKNKIKICLDNIKDRGDIGEKAFKYFQVENPKFCRFYLLPKIHKRLENVPGRPVVSNTGYHTEKISSFLDFQLQPMAQKVKSYIKDTKVF